MCVPLCMCGCQRTTLSLHFPRFETASLFVCCCLNQASHPASCWRFTCLWLPSPGRCSLRLQMLTLHTRLLKVSSRDPNSACQACRARLHPLSLVLSPHPCCTRWLTQCSSYVFWPNYAFVFINSLWLPMFLYDTVRQELKYCAIVAVVVKQQSFNLHSTPNSLSDVKH